MRSATKFGLVLLMFSPLIAWATTCEEATVVETLPFEGNVVDTGNNDITADNAENCVPPAYYGGNEALLRFTPGLSGELSIDYSGQTWTALVVYAGCPTEGGSCVDGVADSSSSKSLTVAVEAGQEYFILVDTWPAPWSPAPGTISIQGEFTDTVFFDRFEALPEAPEQGLR